MIESPYQPSPDRYDDGMVYRRAGRSGVLLPAFSLGMWHNFGSGQAFSNVQLMAHYAFDRGITHFDLANNYGPAYGTAEENFGRLMERSFRPYRDEMFIATKAGYDMWPGPYGNWGSRKYLMASLDQSLKRMGIEYVDIFYSHRPDPDTPIEETMGALADMVRMGKALYVGISRYSPEQTIKAVAALNEYKIPCLIHQVRYSMFDRTVESELLGLLKDMGIGMIVFSPLAEGLLTDRYLNGIPADSRAARATGHLKKDSITPEKLSQIQQLNDIARQRNQTLAQMSISWLLRNETVTSVLIGASSPQQLKDNLKAQENIGFSDEELSAIDKILK